MERKKQNKFLTVAPFKCAWRKELRFKEAGRGCVAFEASADNDVTVVFREQLGSQHYHYRMDNSPNYTVILGSHRNRRLKIEVDGKTVVDELGVGLCCSLKFQSYWISIYDGLISIGKGRRPYQNLVFQWLDTNPNFNVQYVGLSSWDKHVGYRNVNVLPSTQNHVSLWKHLVRDEYEWEKDEEEELEDGSECDEEWGLKDFLESWDLSDMFFVVGAEEKSVPAHKVILNASGCFPFSSSNQHVTQLPGVTYPILHALLQYIYTGKTQILEPQLGSLRDLSLQFEVMPLVKQCQEIIDRFKLNKKLLDSGKKVEISHPCSRPQRCAMFPFEFPINVQQLKQSLSTGEYSDVDIYIDGYGLVARSHKVILSLWSAPFTKMFTNGMSESKSSEICLRDISLEAFTAMLQFMYSGEFDMKDTTDMGSLLLQLVLLADQFGVVPLLQESCKTILECLSEDSVCLILQMVSAVPSCKVLEETCTRKFSKHFDYCTTASIDFVLLDKASFSDILWHPDLTVTSEERILDAILLWGMQSNEVYGWEAVDEILKTSTPELLFRERLQSVNNLLSLVRFPLMPVALLKKLEKSSLSTQISVFEQLVMEGIKYSDSRIAQPENNQNVRFQHRRSTFKELQYICDGDNNGVIYFAGTSCGKHQWVNPVLSKKITVTASSPASRYTDPKALVSRTYQGTSFAGAQVENGKTCAWWMVDIGEDHQLDDMSTRKHNNLGDHGVLNPINEGVHFIHTNPNNICCMIGSTVGKTITSQLMCNYYTLRQDGSTSFMRSWALQGSLDGKNWTNLRVHENDQTICKPGQFASWPVHGPTAMLPFRFFRVILMGPTTSDSSPWNLCLCFLELYGYFHL